MRRVSSRWHVAFVRLENTNLPLGNHFVYHVLLELMVLVVHKLCVSVVPVDIIQIRLQWFIRKVLLFDKLGPWRINVGLTN
jgi:hypothetical protein